MTTLSVLIVDDHRMFGDALVVILGSAPDIVAMPVARDATSALSLAAAEQPDVVLMDVDLPDFDGIEATERLSAISPGSAVIMITASMDASLMTRAVRAGASGFVSKQRAADELLDSVRRAAAGESVFLPHELEALAASGFGSIDQRPSTCPLTVRELEVLQSLTHGMTTEEVARALFLSPRTVQGHVQNILTKVGARSKLEAVLDGLRHGFVVL